jgi:transcription antitermination factor NusA-like protein
MICQLCQKRPATVHVTHCGSDGQLRQDVCEVCAGIKTEVELAQTNHEKKERRRSELAHATELIRKEFFAPVSGCWKQKGMTIMARSFFANLSMFPIASSDPKVDPMEVMFGEAGKGKNHVQRQIEDFQVHFVRWNSDPEIYLKNVFEPFPDAGYRLDLETRQLSVERERTLFPDVQKSYALCNLACYSMSTGTPPDRIEYTFRAQGFPGTL